jgi:cell division protein FtsB
MTKRTPETNKENGYKGQIARLKNENEQLKAFIEALNSEEEETVIETEESASIRSLKRFLIKLIAPLNRDRIKHTNPELDTFIEQTLAAIDFAAEVN